MYQILETLRALLIDHLATAQALTSDAPVGSTLVSVADTSRFRDGDEVYLINGPSVPGTKLQPNAIQTVLDDKTLVLSVPTVGELRVASQAYVQKVLAYQPLKRVHIGDLKNIPSFPTVTLVPTGDSNEWMTLGSTSDEYKVSIRTYMLMDNFEASNKALIRYAEYIREVMTEHIRPIVNGDPHALLADLPVGGKVVTIADTTAFAADMVQMGTSVGFLRDNMIHPSEQENYIKTVLSSTDLEMEFPAQYEYKVSRGAQIIRVTRLLYDSRPEGLTYGYAPGEGGSLMQVSETNWFAKEQICRPGNVLS